MAKNAHGRRPEPEGITTLKAGEGAEVTTRENASHAAHLARANAEKRFAARHSSQKLSAQAARARKGGAEPRPTSAEGPARTRKNIFAIVGAAIAALVLLFFVGRCAAGLLAPASDAPAAGEQAQEQTGEARQDQASSDGSVTLGGVEYTLQQGADGKWTLMSGGETCFSLDGEPAGLILCNGMIVVPETLEDGWDVMAYMPADGSVPTVVADADGNPIKGSGSIESAELDGESVQVRDSTGATTSVSLK